MIALLKNLPLCFAVVLLHLQLFLPREGVGYVTGLVVFIIIWWIIFLQVLPRKVKSQAESGHVIDGSEPGAPVDPRIRYKMKLTTQITAPIWLVYFLLFEYSLVSLETFSFLGA